MSVIPLRKTAGGGYIHTMPMIPQSEITVRETSNTQLSHSLEIQR